MTVDGTTPRTRRAVIASAIGGAAALVASTLGRPAAVHAADDDPVLVGQAHTASTVTTLDAAGTSATALQGLSGSGTGVVGSSENGIGVKGTCSSGIGVWAESTNSPAIHAISDSGDAVEATSVYGAGVSGMSTSGGGVQGESTEGMGVGGFSYSPGMPGIEGRSLGGNTGVFGYAGSAPWTPSTPANTGVYGYADQGGTPVGVRGESITGRGVQGVATSGIGMRASGTTGFGLYASAASGIAVYAATTALKSGTALLTVGRVRFDKSVGLAIIAGGKSSVTVTPGIDLTTSSAVVATLQANAGGSLMVKGVVVNATADTFTIFLTGNAPGAVRVAWHVFG